MEASRTTNDGSINGTRGIKPVRFQREALINAQYAIDHHQPRNGKHAKSRNSLKTHSVNKLRGRADTVWTIMARIRSRRGQTLNYQATTRITARVNIHAS